MNGSHTTGPNGETTRSAGEANAADARRGRSGRPRAGAGDTDYALGRAMLAGLVRHLRASHGINQRDLAAGVGCAHSYIGDIENGQVTPELDKLEAIGRALNARDLLHAVWQPLDAARRERRSAPPGQGQTATLDTNQTTPDAGEDPEGDMERRRLLRRALEIGSAAGLAGALDRLDVVHRTFDDGFTRTVQDWEQIATDYARDIFVLPPDDLAADLSADMLAVRRMLESGLPADEQAALRRVAARLGGLTAMSMDNLGEQHRARQWWRTCWEAADRCGDSDLAAWARARAASQALFEGHSPRQVLTRAERAMAGAPDGGPGMAECLSARAAALARIDPEQAGAALRELRDSHERMPTTPSEDAGTVFGWDESSQRLLDASVLARTGDQTAPEAFDAAFALYEPAQFRERTKIGLWRAGWMVRTGDPAGGTRYATEVVTGLEPRYCDHATIGNARDVARALPADARSTKAATEYRELLAATAPTST